MTTRAPEHTSTTPFPWLPAAGFVLVWSSGYIAGPASVAAAEPFTVLGLRFALATLLFLPVARWFRGPLRIDRQALLRVCAVGVVMNGVQFGFMYLAFEAGLGATLAALLHSLSPVLTVVLAGLFLGERVGRRQVAGLAVGVAGVVLVLGPDVDEAGGLLGLSLGLLGMLSLSLGTMGQRWIPPRVDPWWSATLQFAATTPVMVVLALTLEGTDAVRDPVVGALTIGFLAVINSIVGLVLLGAVVRRGGAGAGSSVFFLSPPVTAVMAWLVLGETLDLRELAGLVVAVSGVALAVTGRAPRPAG
ncbi:DMT family transporter [Nocardioides aestuarii]|uniref:DMT family transporter n=1 Tax=Nocardioides aestuarii TaxID=252231 RepID=A0ABW4TKX8_9ACTN